MKYISIIIFILINACQKPSSKEEHVHTIEESPIEISQPIAREEPVETEPSESHQEQPFMQFFSQFMWDKEFQKASIKYPIHVNGQEVKTPAEWSHHAFYTSKSYIPVLQNDTITHFDQDVTDDEVKMSVISFKEDYVENYFFLKEDGNWKLLAVTEQVIDSLREVEFINFLKRFSSDSAFQVQHIQFPLPNYGVDYDNDYETTYDSIPSHNWAHWELTNKLEGMMSLNVATLSPYRKIFLRGIENGIYIQYTFIRSGDSWRLIKIEDYST
ncbi:DUF4348 domain-containing protein [Fulvivirga kasyanovii]|uniref:DUF4348 domain-containing protein n=1 Tax=Fulvivirga kasyanovii TaxID=396812 RepID=A0ABW9RSJ6_9BACT|nr:DUF4348 domain-containing protein [Fulvivirga kasyanovii]MTI26968.1 DUF4348 domain-containing protein [Fulvivirga kasyanovii]